MDDIQCVQYRDIARLCKVTWKTEMPLNPQKRRRIWTFLTFEFLIARTIKNSEADKHQCFSNPPSHIEPSNTATQIMPNLAWTLFYHSGILFHRIVIVSNLNLIAAHTFQHSPHLRLAAMFFSQHCRKCWKRLILWIYPGPTQTQTS